MVSACMLGAVVSACMLASPPPGLRGEWLGIGRGRGRVRLALEGPVLPWVGGAPHIPVIAA